MILLLSILGDVSAQISISVSTNRTSGNAPLAVNFDASATTAEGVSKPFHNLSYTWDFGDPGAGNWELTTGRDKNKTTGPFVGHVYDEPGNYTATLTVTDFNGHTSSHSINITVSQFSNSIYFSASGDFSGAPAGTQTDPAPRRPRGRTCAGRPARARPDPRSDRSSPPPLRWWAPGSNRPDPGCR